MTRLRAKRVELDPNNDELMDRFNVKLQEIILRFGMSQEQIDLTYEQTAELLGLSIHTVVDYAARGILRHGQGRATVHVDDVVQRLMKGESK